MKKVTVPAGCCATIGKERNLFDGLHAFPGFFFGLSLIFFKSLGFFCFSLPLDSFLSFLTRDQ